MNHLRLAIRSEHWLNLLIALRCEHTLLLRSYFTAQVLR